MGKPMPVQVISHPLEVVDALFQQATEGQRKDGSDFGVAAHLEECLRQIDVSQVRLFCLYIGISIFAV
jgi:hypothetical protein